MLNTKEQTARSGLCEWWINCEATGTEKLVYKEMKEISLFWENSNCVETHCRLL